MNRSYIHAVGGLYCSSNLNLTGVCVFIIVSKGYDGIGKRNDLFILSTLNIKPRSIDTQMSVFVCICILSIFTTDGWCNNLSSADLFLYRELSSMVTLY